MRFSVKGEDESTANGKVVAESSVTTRFIITVIILFSTCPASSQAQFIAGPSDLISDLMSLGPNEMSTALGLLRKHKQAITIGLSERLNAEGWQAYRREAFSIAIYFYELAREAGILTDDRDLLSVVTCDLARSYREQGSLQKAVQYYLEAKEIWEQGTSSFELRVLATRVRKRSGSRWKDHQLESPRLHGDRHRTKRLHPTWSERSRVRFR